MTSAHLLDLTRSLRRAGRVMTGVDRVERAYLSHMLADNAPLFGLVRTPLGYILLDRTGLTGFLERLSGARPWGHVGALSWAGRSRSITVRRAESDLRRLAIARTRRRGLPDMLAKKLPPEFDYYNVGHSNLTPRVMAALRHARGEIHVLIHDVIPLEFPQFQRPSTVMPFEKKLRTVAAHADRLIFNSEDTRQKATGYLQSWGRMPVMAVAHLGAHLPEPAFDQLPKGLLPDRPYFVTAGTIEPRKNHNFLLDLWKEMGPDAPPLLICGSRGWNNEKVFARLDNLRSDSPVIEVADLTDGALAAVVKNAAGSLNPTLAEGFGLPLVEALQLGTRVLCNDLAVFREILGKKPVYASVSAQYAWITAIKNWEQNPHDAPATGPYLGPSWDDHFKTVLRLG